MLRGHTVGSREVHRLLVAIQRYVSSDILGDGVGMEALPGPSSEKTFSAAFKNALSTFDSL